MEYNKYVVIIGDIRNSRHLEDRQEVQAKLNQLLEKVNEKYATGISSKFLITLGDEFQGVLSNCVDVIKIIEEIKMVMYPVSIRFGVGIGEITTDINKERAIGADGPGYYAARAAIERLKENEKKKRAVTADIRLELQNEQASLPLFNNIFELLKAIEDSWTMRQREIIWDMQQYKDGQAKSAERFGIEQPAVHKALVKGNYYLYVKTLENVEEQMGVLL